MCRPTPFISQGPPLSRNRFPTRSVFGPGLVFSVGARHSVGTVGGNSKFAFHIQQGRLVAPKSDEGGRVAPLRRTKLGDDENRLKVDLSSRSSTQAGRISFHVFLCLPLSGLPHPGVKLEPCGEVKSPLFLENSTAIPCGRCRPLRRACKPNATVLKICPNQPEATR